MIIAIMITAVVVIATIIIINIRKMYAKKFLKAVGDVKNADTNTTLTEATKGTMVGAAIGTGIGLFIGFSRKKSLLMSGFVGAIIGGAISRVFLPKN
jgi:hypothetical protein